MRKDRYSLGMTRLCFAFAVLFAALPSAHAAPPDTLELLRFEAEQLAGDEWIASASDNPQRKAFLDVLFTNETWLRELLDSGPVNAGPETFDSLQRIWADDPDIANRRIDRSTATACALGLGKSHANPDLVLDRYEYFRDQHDDENLNTCFDDLATWERRFLARGVQHGGYNSSESMRYLCQRIRWPRSEYVKACWQAPYRLNNCFGDSIHGSMYYLPFQGGFDSQSELTITVGGVCGALSNMGACAAIANGIPALTMGEPGHCAYAVQTAPETWSPAYSMSWKRGLHQSIHRGTWASHMMAQASFRDPLAVAQANDHRRLAQWHEANGEIPRAAASWRSALQRNPLDEGNWKAWFAFGTRTDQSEKFWQSATRMIEQTLLPEHPEPAWTFLQGNVLPTIFANAKPSKRRAIAMSYLRSIESWGPVRWNFEGALNWMVNQIGAQDDQREERLFIRSALRELLDNKTLCSPFVAWAYSRYKDDPENRKYLEEALLAQTGKPGDDTDSALRQLAKRVLPTAAAANDLATFQRIGKAASRLSTPRQPLDEINIKKFEGALLSRGGALRIEGPGNRWDSPEHHWGVLEERGGDFHTNVTELPFAEIELPHFAKIEGILLESRAGQRQRANGARILVSENGTEWTEVATLNGSKSWYRIDLSASQPLARFVRIERDGQCLHFHRFLVYGRRVS